MSRVGRRQSTKAATRRSVRGRTRHAARIAAKTLRGKRRATIEERLTALAEAARVASESLGVLVDDVRRVNVTGLVQRARIHAEIQELKAKRDLTRRQRRALRDLRDTLDVNDFTEVDRPAESFIVHGVMHRGEVYPSLGDALTARLAGDVIGDEDETTYHGRHDAEPVNDSVDDE